MSAIDKHLSRGRKLEKAGNPNAAFDVYMHAIQQYPDNQRLKSAAEALHSGKGIAGLNPPKSTQNRLVAALNQGSVNETAIKARELEQKYPNSQFLKSLLAAAYYETGDLAGSEQYARMAIKLRPSQPTLVLNLAKTLIASDKLDEAERCYRVVLKSVSTNFTALGELGILLARKDNNVEAVQMLRRAQKIAPNDPIVLNNLGNSLRQCGRTSESIEILTKAVALEPDNANYHFNLAVAEKDAGFLDSAIKNFNQSIELDASQSNYFINLGNVLNNRDGPGAGLDCFRRAVQANPNDELANAVLVQAASQQCDWRDTYAREKAKAFVGGITSVPPFAFLGLEDDAEKQQKRSSAWAERYNVAPPIQWNDNSDRLRIGFFSADFHEFPGMHLMIGLLEMLQRPRFEVQAYSYGPDSTDPMRARIIKAVDRFIDVKNMTDDEIVELSRRNGVNIAVHRNGYTRLSRTGIFARRAAPIQINYLGYPGTLAAPFIDYLIADRHVILPDIRHAYSEKIITMPGSYQPTDDTREISSIAISRADEGLPEESIVYCSFNNSHKIQPDSFDCWCEILSAIPDSVLWLLDFGEATNSNLQREAKSRGVDPDRLIFAKRRPQSEHLARHRLADLSLDTFSYTAHTTCSDALWAELPHLTKRGQQFAARVASGLLVEIGLPELVVESECEFVKRAIDLGNDANLLRGFREHLGRAKISTPLFNTKNYTREFEAAIEEVARNAAMGKTPEDFEVANLFPNRTVDDT